MSSKANVDSPFVWFPCLRCGERSVPVGLLTLPTNGQGSTWVCRVRPCESEHYIAIRQDEDLFAIVYQRYTLKYPLEYYDEGTMPPVVRMHVGKGTLATIDEDGFNGPIVVYPRKKRFTSTEIRTIWEATNGRCHICDQVWQLEERGMRGWHVDHVIPHIGGGIQTESIANMRVACATCNLKKGKGYTEAMIKLSLRELVERMS